MRNAAIAIIFNSDKSQILLVKRRDVPTWVLPGGGIDEGEAPAMAAVREAFEETGMSVKVVRQVAEYSPVNRLASQTYTFECGVLEGELVKGSETRDVRFFSLVDLPDSFFYIHRDWLQDALKKAPEIIHRPLSNVTYWAVIKYFCRHPSHVVRMIFSRLGFPLNTKDY
jgi:8-oxo-dGTP diphosphatase